MVVSEIGEMWSPQTAPDRQAATVMISMVDGASPNTAIAIGIRMLNVPQEVPVAKARPSAMRKNTAGMNIPMVDSAFTTEDTKPPMLRYSSRQTPDSVHASENSRNHCLEALGECLTELAKGQHLTRDIQHKGEQQRKE